MNWIFMLILMCVMEVPGWMFAVWSVCAAFALIFCVTRGDKQ